MTRRYKAFISYSWADKAWGEWLHRSLETYRAPKGVADGRSLHPIFKDREEEAAGGSVGAAIEAALEASEFLIVICSPRSAKSAWVNREVAWFKTHKDKRRILALIVDGEPGAGGAPGRKDEECFPKTLTHKVGADLQPTEEWEDAPLAADARPEGDGKRGAKLKLAAALLGVGLDALVRRDERRRTIRRRLVTSAAFGLAAVLGGLAIFAFTQRDAAVIARNDALKARDDAEEIIELILTDLKSDLEGFGTLKSVTAIGNRAIGYYEGQDVKALTPDQLGRRARVLLMLGEADNKRGDLTAALARYETAAATTSEQLARDPGNAQRIYDHAQSVFWVGYIAWQRGDRAKAKEQFTEYHRHAKRLVELDPQNDDWQAELEYSYSNLGTLAMDEGEAAEAEGWFRKSLDVSAALLKKRPDDETRIQSVSGSLTWLANALYVTGRAEDAASQRALQMRLYEKVSGTSAILRSGLYGSMYGFAQTQLALNRTAEARRLAAQAAEGFVSLREQDSKNANLAEQEGFARLILAEAAFHEGDVAASKLHIEEILTVLGPEIGEATELARKISIQALILKARVHLRSAPDLASDILDKVIEELSGTVLNASADRDMTRRYCTALAVRGRLLRKPVGEWEQIVGLLGSQDDLQGPEGLTLLAEALRRTGENERAGRIVAGLHAAGYRHPDFLALLREFPDLYSAATDQAP